MFIEVNKQLSELSREIAGIISEALNAFYQDKFVAANSNRERRRINIRIEERDYFISVQGEGTDIKKYYEEILLIIESEIKI